MKILDGSHVAKERAELLSVILKQTQVTPKLGIILTADDSVSRLYIARKQHQAEQLGLMTELHDVSGESVEGVYETIKKVAADDSVNGCIVQLPLRSDLDEATALALIPDDKDVDGLGPRASHYLAGGKVKNVFLPATPKGVFQLLKAYNISLATKHVVVIGKSRLVGLPTALLAMQAGATVTVINQASTPEDRQRAFAAADVVIAAAGFPGVIKSSDLKEGAIVVDVGITKTENGNLTGDLLCDDDTQICYSPVPGGVGPMTVVSLLENVVIATFRQMNLSLPPELSSDIL